MPKLFKTSFVSKRIQMMRLRLIILISLFTLSTTIRAQSLFDINSDSNKSSLKINGYTAGISYIGLNSSDNLTFSSSLADFGLKLSAGDGIRYKGYVDLRYRYGVENMDRANYYRIREAWAAFYTESLGLSLGQQIIKWGNAEFINNTDLLNPRNDLVRSVDIEDRDLGNILAKLDINLSDKIHLQLIGIPHYKSSVLYTEYMDIGEGIYINRELFGAGETEFSYGVRGTIMLRGFEMNTYWYDGQYLMPGIKLDEIVLPDSQNPLMPEVNLSEYSYNRSMLAADFSFAPESFILKTGLNYSFSIKKEAGSNLPFRQIDFFANIEETIGKWTIILEYSGSKILDYEEAPMEGVLPDLTSFASLPPMTEEQLNDYLNDLLNSFNRLYSYQSKEYYHILGLSISGDPFSMVVNPEIRSLYNFSTNEVMLSPRLSWKARDNVALTLGFEYWQGPNNSIFQMIHRKVNSAFLSLKVSF